MPKVQALHPILATRDVQASLDFFRDKLGFTEPWGFDMAGGEAPTYGGISLDGHELHFVKDEPTLEMAAYIEVDDVARYRNEIVARGANPSSLADQPYGMRDFGITCPGGCTVGFASKIAGS